MIRPDYDQSAEDHQKSLLLLRKVGEQTCEQLFNFIRDLIKRQYQTVPIPTLQDLGLLSVNGGSRSLLVRYVSRYPTENNSWGDFQAHRQLLGVVCIASFVDHEELAAAFRSYEYQKEQYSRTLIDGRLILVDLTSTNADTKSSDRTRAATDHPTTTRGVGSPRIDKETGEMVALPSKEMAKVSSPATTHQTPDRNQLLPRRQSSAKGKFVISQELVQSIIQDAHKEVILIPGSSDMLASAQPPISLHRSSTTSTPSSADIDAAFTNTSKFHTRYRDYLITLFLALDSRRLFRSGLGPLSMPTQIPPASLDPSDHVSTSSSSSSLGQVSSNSTSAVEKSSSTPTVLPSPMHVPSVLIASSSTPMLMAPFEKREMIGLDTDNKSAKPRSRMMKKKCLGREKKHLADLCLQCGLLGDSLLYYQTALQYLKDANDYLWVAACLEGICAASLSLFHGGSHVVTSCTTVSCSSSTSSLRDPPMKQSVVGASPAFFRKNQPASQKLSDSSDSVSSGMSQVLDLATSNQKKILQPEDIVKKYTEAIDHYKKFGQAAVIALEAAIKACRILIGQNKRLEAAHFLQDVISINLQIAEDEESADFATYRFATLAELYGQMGFHRKAAFYKRFASIQCVHQQCYGQPQPKFQRQLAYLKETAAHLGLQMTESWVSRTPEEPGWYRLEARVIQEIIGAVVSLGMSTSIINYTWALLDGWFYCFTTTDYITYLEMLRQRINEVTMASQQDISISLENTPSFFCLQALPYPRHLQPLTKTSAGPKKVDYGPFIYTPLNVGKAEKLDKPESICWLKDQYCEMVISLRNYSPVQLHLRRLSVVCQSVNDSDGDLSSDLGVPLTAPVVGEVESVQLGPFGSTVDVRIGLTPKVCGQVVFTGFRYQLYDWDRLWCFSPLSFPSPDTSILEAMPVIGVEMDLPSPPPRSLGEDKSACLASGCLSLYSGERRSFSLTLTNHSDSIAVSSLALSVGNTSVPWQNAAVRENPERPYIRFSEKEIIAELPLKPTQNKNKVSQVKVTVFVDEANFNSSRNQQYCVPTSRSSVKTMSADGSQTLLHLAYSGGPTEEEYERRCDLALITSVLPGPGINANYFSTDLDLCLHLSNPTTSPAEFTLQWLLDASKGEGYLYSNVVKVEPKTSKWSTIPGSYVRQKPAISDVEADWLVRNLRVEWQLEEPEGVRCGVVKLETSTPSPALSLVETAKLDTYGYRLQFENLKTVPLKLEIKSESDASHVDLVLFRPMRFLSTCGLKGLVSLGVALEKVYLELNIVQLFPAITSNEEDSYFSTDENSCTFTGQRLVKATPLSQSLELIASVLFLRPGEFSVSTSLRCCSSDDATTIPIKISNLITLCVPPFIHRSSILS